MANEVLHKTANPLEFADHAGDFSPSAGNDLANHGTSTSVEMNPGALADGSAYQSAKFDFGATRAREYAVRAAIEFAATPTAGKIVEIYLAPSNNSTAGNGNPGGISGAKSAYTGYSSNLADSIKQLDLIGVFVCTAQATATVQVAECGRFRPKMRYGTLVIKNESGAAFHSDDVEFSVVLDPVVDEIQ